MALSDAEVARYARHLLLPGWPPVTQEFLRAARVHVVGAGDVAGPALVYLAEAGVGSIFIDDGLEVAAEDSAAWIYAPEQVGQPRVLAAAESLRATSANARARMYATGSDPTAALVCASSLGTAREAAERARVAGIPHVVAVADGDGGEVVTVPPGAACYACASKPGSGAPPRPGVAAAVGALAATELLMLLAGVAQGDFGRRIELVLGQPQARPTTRVPGCKCGQPRF
ncbi:MAG TPA: ThiF family adenylyltransferase [Anaeromyxobacteraceae bacterium]|nr:ThiF family adenylyltransferase [Anaeromyxobacteraceae bacterium]